MSKILIEHADYVVTMNPQRGGLGDNMYQRFFTHQHSEAVQQYVSAPSRFVNNHGYRTENTYPD